MLTGNISLLEGLCLSIMSGLFALILAVQFRRGLHHRLWMLSWFFPLVRYRLFMQIRRNLRLEFCDTLPDGTAADWTIVPLRLPRNGVTWLWNPELLVKAPVFQFLQYLTKDSDSESRSDSRVQLTIKVLGNFILQQRGSEEAVARVWRVVLPEADGETVLFESERLRLEVPK